MESFYKTNRIGFYQCNVGCLLKYTVILALMLLPLSALAETARKIRQIDLSVQGIDMLEVRCGAGSLDLKGVEGRDKIHVIAEIEVENIEAEELNNFIENKIRLNLEKQRDKALLRSEISKPPLSDPGARINLMIAIPGKLNVKITDGSGPIRIRNLIGDVRIEDDSGKIRIENIVGNIIVNDGSGGIEIEEISGNVMVRDGSGSIEIDYITGDVYVVDGSGDMTILHIDGNVTVSDETGEIDISDVSKNVFINETISGEVSIERVKGKVSIRE